MSGKVADEIDAQVQFLHRSRSMFPRLAPGVVGHSTFDTAPHYESRGLRVSFQFSAPLTAQFVDEFNDLGHWINQNFVLRLYAVLDRSGLIAEGIKRVEGQEEVDILRRLRNVFGHGSGRYDRADSEKRKLFERIVSHFKLSPAEYEEGGRWFSIPIDTVLVPLAEGCKRYAVACENLT